jgi:hypothetical protein
MNGLTLALSALLLLAACTGFPFWGRAAPDHQKAKSVYETGSNDGGAESQALARVELENAHYDGRMLKGRLLVGASDRSLALDKRIIESIYLTTESVLNCATGQKVGFVVMDVYAQRPREEDILILEPGYWYGKDVSILLFSEEPLGQSTPPCIEAEFAFRAMGGKAAAILRVRAMRDAQAVPDAGVYLDAGMTTDPASEEMK